jgi:hypothetical protein
MFGGIASHQPPLPVESAASNDPESFCILSPKKLALHSVGSISARPPEGGYIQAAGFAGASPAGHPRVALSLGGRPPQQHPGVLVFDATTGETVNWIRCRYGVVSRYWKPVSGRIAGGAQRHWLAWSEESPANPMLSPRLFAMEIGDDTSVREIALPRDRRSYAQSGCAVSVEGSNADALAIGVSAWGAKTAAREAAPIMYLDVTRCLVQR